MTSSRRPSAQTTAVVLALAEQPATWRYGYALCQQLDLKAGSVYPILMRLADRGLLETTWESEVPAGRPRRAGRAAGGPARTTVWPPHPEPRWSPRSGCARSSVTRRLQAVPPKSTSLVSTVPAVRPGAVWSLQYRFVCAMT